MIILGIETSCDETSAALLQIENSKIELLGLSTFSQIKEHTKYGGIVPEVAARLHVPKIIPIIEHVFEQAALTQKNLDYIGVTAGPGLVTSLIVGIHTARTLSYVWQKPLIAVNHMEGHVVSSLLSQDIKSFQFPALCLTISGGHTELVLIKKWGDYTIIGSTRDDAVGECFDKVAKMLDLPYPGGPQISQLAEHATQPISFTPPMLHSSNFDFSFSGLKTAVLYIVREYKKHQQLDNITKANIAAGFQNAAIKVLVHKTIQAAQKYNIETIVLGGGVAANKLLRKELQNNVTNILGASTKLYIPEMRFCTDNAAMIAVAAYFQVQKKNTISPELIKADPNWVIGTQPEK